MNGFSCIQFLWVLYVSANRSTNMARCRTAVSGVLEAPIDEEETDISGNECLPQNQDENVGYLRCPCCGSNHLTLTKEIPKRRIVEEKPYRINIIGSVFTHHYSLAEVITDLAWAFLCLKMIFQSFHPTPMYTGNRIILRFRIVTIGR